jgi:hypothetical protein
VSRCPSGCRCDAFCVTGAVVAWPQWALCHVATVGVITLHFVSQALSLHGCGRHRVAVAFVVWPQWVSSCCVVLRSGLLHGRGGCHRATWDHGD